MCNEHIKLALMLPDEVLVAFYFFNPIHSWSISFISSALSNLTEPEGNIVSSSKSLIELILLLKAILSNFLLLAQDRQNHLCQVNNPPNLVRKKLDTQSKFSNTLSSFQFSVSFALIDKEVLSSLTKLTS